MQLSNEDRACLWLSDANISTYLFNKLLHTYSSIYEAFLNYESDKTELFTADQISLLDKSKKSLNHTVESMDKGKINMLIYDSANYPKRLKGIKDAPYMLFYKGNLSVLNDSCIAIVGTRKPSFYGKKVAKILAEKLASVGACVVSGMALGIDTYAHSGSTGDTSANTCAVCGCGLNIDYPASNRALKDEILAKGGLLLSEYTPDTVARNYFFPYRNRIISGLSDAVVFVEGEIHSGGMLTVDRAIEQGRKIYAVPGNIDSRFSSGPNSLLSHGEALCLNNIDEFVNSINSNIKVQTTNNDELLQDFNLNEQRVYRAIEENNMSADELVINLGIDFNTIQISLAKLELYGLIQRAGGGTFSIN